MASISDSHDSRRTDSGQVRKRATSKFPIVVTLCVIGLAAMAFYARDPSAGRVAAAESNPPPPPSVQPEYATYRGHRIYYASRSVYFISNHRRHYLKAATQ